MKSLTEALEQAKRDTPTRHPRVDPTEAHVDYDDAGNAVGGGAGFTSTIDPESITEHRANVEKSTGLPVPANLDVIPERITLQSDADGSAQRWWYKYKFVPSLTPNGGDGHDFASLMTLARKSRKKPRTRPEAPRASTVVVYADPQAGKVASRGGSVELVERVQQSLVLLDDYLDRVPSDEAHLLDAGDAIEGFESVGAQSFTNDLSLPRQVELASDFLFEFTHTLAMKRDHVKVVGVGSNHCRWRKGKEALGLPGDDWGVHMLRQLKKALTLNDAYAHVDVEWPGDHDETMSFDVCGTRVGLAHGHQASRPEGIPKWWAGQAHGGQPVGQAEILVTGHFHSFRTEATGRDPWTKREKRWFQGPTLDNGSDWYRMTSGSDSDPGLLVFTVDANGWRNLEVLRPDAVEAVADEPIAG